MKYKIVGGKKLSGEITIGGNKNAILPCMAASILADEVIVIENVPSISDVVVMSEILRKLGAIVTRENNHIKIDSTGVKNIDIPEVLSSKLRASILLAGPMLARFGSVNFSHPGGDVIGVRSLKSHFDGFRELGYEVVSDDLRYSVRGGRSAGEVGIFMEEASVTATENIIMAAVLGKNKVVLKNCAQEPHIVDLCQMLNQMGAKIDGFGTSKIVIEGVENLKGTTYRIGSDFVEFGTYAVAAAITGGQIKFLNCSLTDWEPILVPMKKMGLEFETQGNPPAGGVMVKGKDLVGISKLHTNIWPGFPSDMISIMIILATQSAGVSLIHDWMYESRFFFVDKLIGMGAHITIADPHRVLVYGKTELVGRNMDSPDIRAGMAMVLAALIAKGESTISRAELVERGYEDVVSKLKSLGADISVEE